MIKIVKKIMEMNKVFLFITTFIIVVVIMFFGYAFYMRNDTAKRYIHSIECIDNEKYDEAISILSSMKDYKDSTRLIDEAQKGRDYQSAEKLIQEKKYEEAIKLLEELGDYNDAKHLCNKAKSVYAKELLRINNTVRQKYGTTSKPVITSAKKGTKCVKGKKLAKSTIYVKIGKKVYTKYSAGRNFSISTKKLKKGQKILVWQVTLAGKQSKKISYKVR